MQIPAELKCCVSRQTPANYINYIVLLCFVPFHVRLFPFISGNGRFAQNLDYSCHHWSCCSYPCHHWSCCPATVLRKFLACWTPTFQVCLSVPEVPIKSDCRQLRCASVVQHGWLAAAQVLIIYASLAPSKGRSKSACHWDADCLQIVAKCGEKEADCSTWHLKPLSHLRSFFISNVSWNRWYTDIHVNLKLEPGSQLSYIVIFTNLPQHISVFAWHPRPCLQPEAGAGNRWRLRRRTGEEDLAMHGVWLVAKSRGGNFVDFRNVTKNDGPKWLDGFYGFSLGHQKWIYRPSYWNNCPWWCIYDHLWLQFEKSKSHGMKTTEKVRNGYSCCEGKPLYLVYGSRWARHTAVGRRE